MQELSAQGRRLAEEVAARHGLSVEAVAVLLRTLAAGSGTMAQFSHPDLGGMGQWSQGGMVMIGDMFNHGLKQRVDAACTELAGQLRSRHDLFAAPPAPAGQSQQQGGGSGASFTLGGSGAGSWWPAELGSPSATGAQNHVRYACFPQTRRLALEINGRVTVYDTGDHRITGFGQQQGGDASLTFTSQHGLVRIADLPIVAPVQVATRAASAPASASPAAAAPPARVEPPAQPGPGAADQDQILATIERLAGLKEKGILSEAEFAAKKAELLSRL
ncbi:MAG TPA: SHOCT domain-containing protein [Geminicoccus sp.]|uniref:SHOCT domain-containing protein n=1 Tax=Geminicoccus sp. TaxID=2024832 RepID=UPI002D0A0EA6|nr:SHOCT domain-containing protein [Geminicoccus sp.]HWL67206.1 SHOCT domain-containing protein [Geminicoccus sp.]